MTSFEAKHGRPKPPRVNSLEYREYQRKYQTISIFRFINSSVDSSVISHPSRGFVLARSISEAIQYAHKLAYERSQNVHR